MDFLPILNYVFWGVLGFFVIISALIGLGRKLPNTIVRLSMVILSFALAVILSRVLLMNFAKPLILNYVNDMLASEPTFSELAQASPTMMAFVPDIALSIVTPIVFLVVFIVCLLLTSIIGLIIKLILKKRFNGKRNVVSVLLSVVASFVSGVIIASGILLPFAGYATTVSNVYSNLESKNLIAAEDSSVQFAEDLKAMKDSTPVKIVYSTTGFIFNGMLTYTDPDGQKINTLEEVDAVIDILPPILDVANIDFSNIENLNTKPFKDIVANLDKSKSIKKIVAEIMSAAGGKWLNGQAFMGLNVKEQLPEDIKNYFDVVFEKLSNTTAETLASNLNELISEMETLSQIYPEIQEVMNMDFANLESLDLTPIKTIINKIDETTIVKHILAQIVAGAGEKWLNNQAFVGLNAKEQLPEAFRDYLDVLFEKLSTITPSTLSQSLNEIVGEAEVLLNVYPEIQRVMATDFSNMAQVDLSPLKNVTQKIENTSLVKQILAPIFADAGDSWLNGEDFAGINFNDKLPLEFQDYFGVVFEKISITTTSNLVDNLNDLIFEMENLVEIYPEIEEIKQMDFSDIPSIDTAPIKTISVEIEDTTLIKQVLAPIFADAGDSWSQGNEFLGINVKESLPTEYKNSFDSVLELMKNTTEETLTQDLNAFADTTNSVIKAYDYYTSINDSTLTEGEIVDKLLDTLTSVTPENVDLLEPVVSQETMVNVGLDDNSAEVVSSILKDSLNDISQMENEEDVQKEAEAINEIMNFVNPESAGASEPNEMIEKLTQTTAVKDAIVDYAEQPESKNFTATEIEKVQVSAAIESYKSGDSYTAEDDELLTALESLFGLNAA